MTLDEIYAKTWYRGITEEGKRYAEEAYSNDAGIDIKDLTEEQKEEAYVKLFRYDVFLPHKKQIEFFIYKGDK